jgi:hypothetical protein
MVGHWELKHDSDRWRQNSGDAVIDRVWCDSRENEETARKAKKGAR